MAMFKSVATETLRLQYTVLLLGSMFRVRPASPTSACGPDLYVRVVLAHHSLVLAVFAAAVLLQLVRVAVSSAEADCIAAARAAAGAKDKDFDAEHEAAVAAVKGLRCVAAKRHRASLRALLLVGVALSFAASFFAVVSIEDGYLYVNGCDADHAGYGFGAPMGVVMMAGMAFLHGRAAWAAVFED
jgi:hypothetical protein